MSLATDLLELSQHLQQEYLFVTTEREQLQRLYHSTTLLSERLLHSSWIVRQQKHTLQQFINLGNTGENVEAYVVNNQLEETSFVDSYKVFSYHDSKYGDLYRFLYEHPSVIASLILEGEKQSLNVSNVINLTISSIYANCLFREDEQAVLRLLKSLLDNQLASSDNPRRLIRRQTTAFSKVFRQVSESLFSARLFLTAALYEPIMCLLMEDEWFYDIDPDKAFVRFPHDEKLKRFGEPGTDDHKIKQEKYRKFIVDKLVILALRFINGIKAKIHCFPSAIGWLISQVYHVLTEKGLVSMQEIRACCADLVFSLFICPAICDPEPHGIISDVAISHIARHNLMQMAQIIQVMAISQWDEIDVKVRDLYGRFDKGSMSSILDLFLEGCWDDFIEQVASENMTNIGASRSAVLLTIGDMKEMIGFLRSTTPHVGDKGSIKKQMESLLATLPADIPPSQDTNSMPRGVITPPISSSTPNLSGGVSSYMPDSPGSLRKPLFKNKGQKKKSPLPTTAEDVQGDLDNSELKASPISDVLVLSIYPPNDCPGMVPEIKVLSSMEESSPTKSKPQSPLPPQAAGAIISPAAAPNPEVQEKRTRFSLSHDQESIVQRPAPLGFELELIDIRVEWSNRCLTQGHKVSEPTLSTREPVAKQQDEPTLSTREPVAKRQDEPTLSTREPVAKQQDEPTLSTREPVAKQQDEPTLSTREPVAKQQDEPTLSTREPVAKQQGEPTLSTREPVAKQQDEPTLSTREPVAKQQDEPTLSTREPVAKQQDEPTLSTREPVAKQQDEPTLSTREPVAKQQGEPTLSTREPVAKQQDEPTLSTREPVAKQQDEPTLSTREPVAKQQGEPTLSTREPVAKQQGEPTLSTREPVAKQQGEPTLSTREPVAKQQDEPTLSTREPVAKQQDEPTLSTREPVAKQQGEPTLSTREPVAKQQDEPTLSTREPVAKQQDEPTLSTREPVAKQQDEPTLSTREPVAKQQGEPTLSIREPVAKQQDEPTLSTREPVAKQQDEPTLSTREPVAKQQGNASDYQEVISEAASSHSVEDEENELETDNFSDMMSANVSGRGSPSISGRDTPLSQAGSVEENPVAPQLPVPVPETVRKENRVDVTDRFGKFEIKAELVMERDECKSTVSDTWSTDVLASDSEPPESNHVDRLEEVAEEISRPYLPEPISEISETASDAWSTDVLASDTDEKHSELLKDLEQDLMGGVMDRDEGDNSIGHDEGEDPSLENDQLGAVGGAANVQGHSLHSDSCDAFPDVFSDLSPSQRAVEDGDQSSNTKKSASAATHSGFSSLQLPSAHRPPLRNSDNRATVGFATTMESTLMVAPVHSSTGARSKVKDKEGRRRMREGRGHNISSGHTTGASGDDSQVVDFDPLSSGGSSSGSFRGWKDGRKSSKNVLSEPLKLEGQGMGDGLDSSGLSSHRDSGREELSSPRVKSHGRKSARNSGTDIWVSTNGQMSGSSSRSPVMRSNQSSFDSGSDNFSPAPDHSSASQSSRSMFETNLHLQNAGVKNFSTPDSGLDSGLSVSSELSSADLRAPLFQLVSDSGNISRGMSNSSTPIGLMDKVGFNTSPNDSQNAQVLDLKGETASRGPLGPISPQGDHQDVSGKTHKSQNRNSAEVFDIFEDMASQEAEVKEEEGEERDEQQNVALDEKRLSSALILFDPLCTESDDGPMDVSDLTFDSARPREQGVSNRSADAKANGVVVVVQEDDDEDKRSPDLPVKKHQRQDSSGSSHSASSLKINVSDDVPSKDSGGDNISLMSAISVTSDDRDMTEDERALHRHKKGGRGFLSSVRDKFSKGIRRKNTKFEKDFLENVSEGNSPGLRKNNSSSSLGTEASLTPTTPPTTISSSETTDDILAKYRTPKKPATKTAATTNNNSSSAINNNISSMGSSSNSGKNRMDSVDGESSGANANRGGAHNSQAMTFGHGDEVEDGHRDQFLDVDNLENCPAFWDAKRKLRIVLSMGDVYFNISQVHSSSPRENSSWKENELIHLLNIQLAEAINLQNKDLIAQLYEVIRCIKLFDPEGCKKLLVSMREDYQRRSPYISYLVRCRQGLLTTRNHLQRLLNRVNRDREIYNKHLSHMTARRFLEKSDKKMWRFIMEFQKLTMSDEKIDLVERCLQYFYQEMTQDSMWRNCTDGQMEDAQFAVERFLMSRIYTHAMFPNGDGDVLRDQLLQEHLRKLSKVICPNHKDLRIPSVYHTECPWPAAQKEIYKINAYRTPKDKILCVLRCAQTIMNLLSLANQKSVPAADDFMPVLIFVLIKANPFGLLSTIQYVNSFYANRIHGEEQYWWLQLTSAVEFIKTMDYSH